MLTERKAISHGVKSLRSKFTNIRKSTHATGSFITVTTNGLSAIIYGFSSIWIARTLGPEQAGLLAWFVAGTATAALFADILGLYYSSSYILAHNKHGFDESTIRSTVLCYGSIAGLLVGIGIGGVGSVRGVFFENFEDATWSTLIILNIFGLTLASQIRGIYWGQSNFLMSGLSNFSRVAVYAAIAVVGMYFLGWNTGSQFGIAQVAGTWLPNIVFVLYLMADGIARPRFAYISACMQVGWRAVLVNWLGFLQLRADQYLVHQFLGSAALGFYSVAVTISGVITLVPTVLGHVIFSFAATAKDQSRTAKTTIRLAIISMSIMAVLCTPVAIFASPLIQFMYGSAFLPVVPVLQFLFPAIIFLGGIQLIQWHIAGLGYPKTMVLLLAGSLVVNIGCNFLLLPRVGVIGASIASSISYFICLILIGAYLMWHSRTVVESTDRSDQDSAPHH